MLRPPGTSLGRTGYVGIMSDGISAPTVDHRPDAHYADRVGDRVPDLVAIG